MVSVRPGNASGKSLSSSSRAEPVSRNLPGRGSRSTSRLIASSSSGTRWISSIISKPSCRTKALGSASAAARTAWSSKYSSRAPGERATMSSARVLFPTCLAPFTTTTRVSASASAAIRSACRKKRSILASIERHYRSSPQRMGRLPLLPWAICRVPRGRFADALVSDLPLRCCAICRSLSERSAGGNVGDGTSSAPSGVRARRPSSGRIKDGAG
jgi:hypothetical protein